METFDLKGPLPQPRSTTVLLASAGTAKTFALAGLVTRYLAETETTLDEMLLITFNRAASRELRERVRGKIVETVDAEIASELQWPTQHDRVVAAARGIYRGQPAGVPTWSGYKQSERLDVSYPPWWA